MNTKSTVNTAKVQKLSSFAWSIAEILRGDFKQSDYAKVVLPFIILRRLDCILEDSKEKVIAANKNITESTTDQVKDMMLFNAVGGGLKLYNTHKLTLTKIKEQEAKDLQDNLVKYVSSFNASVRDIFLEKFKITDQIKKLKDGGLLFQVFEKFVKINLHPDNVSNIEMGYLFEDLIRKFSEMSNETAGEHFTPREVIKLLVDLLIQNDRDALSKSGIIRTVYDPACGTGGMLAIAEEAMKKLNDGVKVELYGQELNGESFGICKSDMLVTGHNPEQIAFGNTLTDDAHKGQNFHYMISNPPYGVDWKKYKDPILAEAELDKGLENSKYTGRFGAGTPRVSDGQLLFLQHMVSKMRDDETGSKIGIVMNGSPLFTGGANSGESEIRRWLLEQDLVESIIALPTDLFYNTGIQTYVWLLTNRKEAKRLNKVQLIDASGEAFWKSMRKNLGSKRREIPTKARDKIVNIFNNFDEENEYSKIFDTEDFGYREIRVERPLKLNFQVTEDRLEVLKQTAAFLKLAETDQFELVALVNTIPKDLFKNRNDFDALLTKALKPASFKIPAPLKKAILQALSEKDETADICRNAKGNMEPDTDLRDTELVPLKQDYKEYIAKEVTPFVPDAWVDESHTDSKDGNVGRIGYEINFNRYFYKYVAPRPVAEIDAELKVLEAEIADLLKGAM